MPACAASAWPRAQADCQKCLDYLETARRIISSHLINDVRRRTRRVWKIPGSRNALLVGRRILPRAPRFVQKAAREDPTCGREIIPSDRATILPINEMSKRGSLYVSRHPSLRRNAGRTLGSSSSSSLFFFFLLFFDHPKLGPAAVARRFSPAELLTFSNCCRSLKAFLS